jgi:photosystem II stability/assembly factor-like uncharacterized protein
MKIKLIIYLICLITLTVYSQNRWMKLNGPEGAIIIGLFAKGDTILAGTNFTALIFYSTDGGLNWNQSDFKIRGRATDFTYTDDAFIVSCARPGAIDGNTLYKSYNLTIWNKLSPQGEFWSAGRDYLGNIYAGTDDGKMFMSTDDGATWTYTNLSNSRVNNFVNLHNLVIAGIDGAWIKYPDSGWVKKYLNGYSVATDEVNDIFSFSASTFYASTDFGETWKQRDINGHFLYNNCLSMVYNQRLIAGFNDETGWFGDGWGTAVSDDKGWTWRWSQTGLPPKITVMRLAKSGSDTYIGTNGAGVFKSTDYGDSWFPVNNGIHAAYVVDINFDEEGTLYSAAWSSGLSKSTDLGNSWKMINNGLTNVYFYCILPDDDGILYSGSEKGAFRSTDKGENWMSIARPGNGFVFNLKKDKKNRIYALTYGSGLYRTTDKGESWVRLDQNLFHNYFIAMAFDSLDNIYAGDGNRIFNSSDDGQSWIKMYEGIPLSAVTGLAVSPRGNIFAAVDYEGVLRSTDGGDTWELKSDGVSKYLSTLNIDENGNIYVTKMNKGGIWQSTDEGENWNDFTSNLPLTQVNRIIFRDNELYLATDESVWKSNPDSLTSVAEDVIKPKEYFLSQNYPNPFNPSTTIKYSLPQAGRVTLSIYDLLGREVIKLIDEEKPAGEYEINWNASSHPSGVYFMRMQAGEFGEVRKVVLVK